MECFLHHLNLLIRCVNLYVLLRSIARYKKYIKVCRIISILTSTLHNRAHHAGLGTQQSFQSLIPNTLQVVVRFQSFH
ncbi:unnamed protein product [Albugo candida]|uniref:Uncharacterized protein n=1 Tax=Albugo candida TaxID=65357 RepID=A0A024GFI0_9STRA|nr:unnamed protein product [Albugo candida]|eukprot:CCI45288.1 unnamed protein product [Albugo candida]